MPVSRHTRQKLLLSQHRLLVYSGEIILVACPRPVLLAGSGFVQGYQLTGYKAHIGSFKPTFTKVTSHCHRRASQPSGTAEYKNRTRATMLASVACQPRSATAPQPLTESRSEHASLEGQPSMTLSSAPSNVAPCSVRVCIFPRLPTHRQMPLRERLDTRIVHTRMLESIVFYPTLDPVIFLFLLPYPG